MPKFVIASEIQDSELEQIAKQLNLRHPNPFPLKMTWYPFEYKKEKEKEIEGFFKETARPDLRIMTEIESIATTDYNAVRFQLDHTDQIRMLHGFLTLMFSYHRDIHAKTPIQERYLTYDQIQRDMIEMYGRPKVMHLFEPHITIGKIDKKDSKVHQPFKKTILLPYPSLIKEE
jgi:hypothetical protein